MKPFVFSKPLGGVLAVVALVACAHKPPATPATETPDATSKAATPSAPATPPAPPPATCKTDDQCASSQLCLDGVCTAITPSLAACGVTRVHFDFDADLLHPAEYPLLQRAARCIEANNPAYVLIAGNADERGTVEYNLALGQRRAAAVRKYLVQLGVSAAHLDAVSYGKEMPLCADHDEACWQKNRRSAIRPGEKPADVGAKVKADEKAEKGAKP